MHVCSGWCFEMPFCGIYPVLVPQEGWVFLGVWVWGPTCERTIHPMTDFSVHRCHVAGLTAYVFRDSSFCACRLRFLFESCWRLLTVNSTRKPFWITILLFLFLLRSPKQVGRNPATWVPWFPLQNFILEPAFWHSSIYLMGSHHQTPDFPVLWVMCSERTVQIC